MDIGLKMLSLHFHETAHAAGVGSSAQDERALKALQEKIELQAKLMKYETPTYVTPLVFSPMIEKSFENLLRRNDISQSGFCVSLSKVVDGIGEYPTYETQESNGKSYITQTEESFLDLYIWQSAMLLSNNCEGAEEDRLNFADERVIKALGNKKQTSLHEVLLVITGNDFCDPDYYASAVCAKAKSMTVHLGMDTDFMMKARATLNELEDFLKKIYAPNRYVID
jgi:hypothetical protein